MIDMKPDPPFKWLYLESHRLILPHLFYCGGDQNLYWLTIRPKPLFVKIGSILGHTASNIVPTIQANKVVDLLNLIFLDRKRI